MNSVSIASILPTSFVTFMSLHHAQIAYATGAVLAILNLAIKVALWVHPLNDWVTIAEKKPRIAAIVRLSMALGINPVSVLQAMIDFVRGHASPGTLASVKAIQVSASKPLIAPVEKKEEKTAEIKIEAKTEEIKIEAKTEEIKIEAKTDDTPQTPKN